MPTLNPEEIDPRDLPPLSPGDNGGLSPDYAHSNPRSEPTSNLLKDSDHPNLEITEDYLLSATSFLDAITDVNPIEPFAITSHINKCAQATDSRTIDLDALAECLARGDEKVAVMARCEEWPKFPPMLIMSVVGEDREDQDEGKRRLEFCDIGDLKATIADIDRVITWVATNPNPTFEQYFIALRALYGRVMITLKSSLSDPRRIKSYLRSRRNFQLYLAFHTASKSFERLRSGIPRFWRILTTVDLSDEARKESKVSHNIKVPHFTDYKAISDAIIQYAEIHQCVSAYDVGADDGEDEYDPPEEAWILNPLQDIPKIRAYLQDPTSSDFYNSDSAREFHSLLIFLINTLHNALFEIVEFQRDPSYFSLDRRGSASSTGSTSSFDDSGYESVPHPPCTCPRTPQGPTRCDINRLRSLLRKVLEIYRFFERLKQHKSMILKRHLRWIYNLYQEQNPPIQDDSESLASQELGSTSGDSCYTEINPPPLTPREIRLNIPQTGILTGLENPMTSETSHTWVQAAAGWFSLLLRPMKAAARLNDTYNAFNKQMIERGTALVIRVKGKEFSGEHKRNPVDNWDGILNICCERNEADTLTVVEDILQMAEAAPAERKIRQLLNLKKQEKGQPKSPAPGKAAPESPALKDPVPEDSTPKDPALGDLAPAEPASGEPAETPTPGFQQPVSVEPLISEDPAPEDPVPAPGSISPSDVEEADHEVKHTIHPEALLLTFTFLATIMSKESLESSEPEEMARSFSSIMSTLSQKPSAYTALFLPPLQPMLGTSSPPCPICETMASMTRYAIWERKITYLESPLRAYQRIPPTATYPPEWPEFWTAEPGKLTSWKHSQIVPMSVGSVCLVTIGDGTVCEIGLKMEREVEDTLARCIEQRIANIFWDGEVKTESFESTVAEGEDDAETERKSAWEEEKEVSCREKEKHDDGDDDDDETEVEFVEDVAKEV